MLYVRNTEPSIRTDTNEIAYWTDRFERQFGTPFYVFGFYRNRELVGYAEAAYLKTARVFALDYLVIDERHRQNNVFYEFVDHLKRFLEEAHPDFEYGIIEVPYGPGQEHPSPRAQLLIRLLKLQGFHVVHANFYQPRLTSNNAESEMRADLLIYSPESFERLKVETYLAIVRALYFDYYLPWGEFNPEDQEADRRDLERLFSIIRASLKGRTSVLVNGHKTVLPSLPPARRTGPHRIVSFAAQASIVVVAVAGALLGLRHTFQLSDTSLASIFVLAFASFIALAAIVSKDAREVMRQLMDFAKQFATLRRAPSSGSPELPPPSHDDDKGSHSKS